MVFSRDFKYENKAMESSIRVIVNYLTTLEIHLGGIHKGLPNQGGRGQPKADTNFYVLKIRHDCLL